MRFSSFRAILLKKVDDPAMREFIGGMDDNFIASAIVESLEKARGRLANKNLVEFAQTLPEHMPDVIHDNLSHHATNYRAALKAGNKGVANKHMLQIYKTMDLASQIPAHNPSFSFEHVNTHPWERNSKTKTNADLVNEKKQLSPDGGDESLPAQLKHGTGYNHSPVNDTKGLNYWKSTKNPDFSFLAMSPHVFSHDHAEVKRGHRGAYPLEHTKINGQHIDIKDVDSSGEYVPHPFDSHPIFNAEHGFSVPSKKIDDQGHLIDRHHQDVEDFDIMDPDWRKYLNDLHAKKNSGDQVDRKQPGLAAHEGMPVDPLTDDKINAHRAKLGLRPTRKIESAPNEHQLTSDQQAAISAAMSPEESKSVIDAVNSGKTMEEAMAGIKSRTPSAPQTVRRSTSVAPTTPTTPQALSPDEVSKMTEMLSGGKTMEEAMAALKGQKE